MRAAVDREGTVLRLSGPGGSGDVADRVAGLVGEMGFVAQPLGEAPSVPRWFHAAEVDELSSEEASVLAERFVAELTDQNVIQDAGRIAGPLRDWLLDAFRDAARSGVLDAPAVDEGMLRARLDPDDAAAVRRWLEQKLGTHDE